MEELTKYGTGRYSIGFYVKKSEFEEQEVAAGTWIEQDDDTGGWIKQRDTIPESWIGQQ